MVSIAENEPSNRLILDFFKSHCNPDCFRNITAVRKLDEITDGKSLLLVADIESSYPMYEAYWNLRVTERTSDGITIAGKLKMGHYDSETQQLDPSPCKMSGEETLSFDSITRVYLIT
ncbi:hypothetical protein GF386_04160 [Candidatus Pacearchaeota archaeon]|nr:hypothetical protein [Candidatus Pacearchaeota archaeon]